MLMPIVILGVAGAAIVLLLLLLRTNAAVVFLALCAGNLLVNQLGYDATSAARMVTHNDLITNNGVHIAILVLPAIFSALFLRSTMRGSRTVLNIVPAVATAALTGLLVMPLLPGSAQKQIVHTSQWTMLTHYQAVVLIVGIIASMVVFWLTSSRGSDHSSKKHKKH